MPLDKAALASGLAAIADDPPGSHAGAASLWAAEIASYASEVLPATILPPTAESALESELAAAFASPDAWPPMETAFTNFATQVALGMAPAFTGTPPAGAVGFAALYTAPTDDTQAAADTMATAIDVWMKTGTAVPSGGGPAVNWS